MNPIIWLWIKANAVSDIALPHLNAGVIDSKLVTGL